MEICGRKLKIVTGTKSQTVSICTGANVQGQYDYRIRLRPPFTSEEALAGCGFETIDDLVHFLERSCDGRVEQAPITRASGFSEPMLPGGVNSAIDRQGAVQSEFSAWREAWDRLGERGEIVDVLDLWRAPVPDPWMRAEMDTPERLRTGDRYTRGNLHGVRRGEHGIEYEILIQQFESVTCLGEPLLDGVNAFPLVKDQGHGRNCNVEADLVLLAGKREAACILVCDVKIGDGNPWKALLQNLRQLRLFTLNPICVEYFLKRSCAEKIEQVCGAVIAPERFYSHAGKRSDSLRRAQALSAAMAQAPDCVTAELLVWDAAAGRMVRPA